MVGSSGASFRSRRAVLLPVLLSGAVAFLCLGRNVARTFQAPGAGLRPLRRQRSPSGLQQRPETVSFAGHAQVSGVKTPARPLADEASSLTTVLAATALAAVAMQEGGSAQAMLESPKKGFLDSMKLPIICIVWYYFNVQYNIQNKLLLQTFSATWAVAWFQLAAGIPIGMAMWAAGMAKVPSVTKSDLTKLVPMGLVFAGAQCATVASLGAVAVSFTHVVKALEPGINAVASAVLLGQVYHPMVYLSLAPVFFGVALASSGELSFTMFGFLTAMLSNIMFVTRNVLSVKYGSVGDFGEDKTTRKTNQLIVLTIIASAVLFPIALFLPGGLLSMPSAWAAAISAGTSAKSLVFMIASSGFYFFMYQLLSFWVLASVPPITHSVLNTLKRVVVIVSSIIVFHTPVTKAGGLGTAIAIGGVMLYTQVKSYYENKKCVDSCAVEM